MLNLCFALTTDYQFWLEFTILETIQVIIYHHVKI